MNFEEYLASKKINKEAFKNAESERYQQWEKEFPSFSAQSFSMQKLFLINTIRRNYPLPVSE